ncbi:hypothetical protein PHISCL_00200 [Aspergillus sclerotialis]|uniref:SH3 domain-containing protein n=1 Tax=Aspergillus sclerotialis TaxID=2070753 RepID=A0A3A2ZWP8_9EURO|nr:hypothetical protein PHISCL_00200 [Aspergillus sclerotialis]
MIHSRLATRLSARSYASSGPGTWSGLQGTSQWSNNDGQYYGLGSTHGTRYARYDDGQYHPGQYQSNSQSWNQHGPAQVGSNDQQSAWTQHQQTQNYDDGRSNQQDHDLTDPPGKGHKDNDTLFPTNTQTLLPTLETSLSPTATGSHETTDSASITPVPTRESQSSGLTPSAKAGLSISVIVITAAVVGLILYPLWRHHRRVQAALGRNPKMKLESDLDSDSEKPNQVTIVDSLQHLGWELHTKAVTGICAAAAFLKSKGPAAMTFGKRNSDCVYTQSSFLHSFPGDTSNAAELEAGVVGTSDSEGDGSRSVPARPEKRRLPTKFPLLSAESSVTDGLNKRDKVESNSPSPTETGTRPGTATSSRHQSPRIPQTTSQPLLEPLQKPQISHSASTTSSSAWETQHDAHSPVPSQGSPRSPSNPLGHFENNSTGNVLALSPSINKKYVVEQDFHATSPGQLDLRAGDEVGISQVLDNGWVLCIQSDCTAAGLVPRSHLASGPSGKSVRIEDKRRSYIPQKEGGGSARQLGSRFYSFFRLSNSHAAAGESNSE